MNLFELVATLTLDSSEYDRALLAAKGSTAKAGDGMVKAIGKTKKAIGVAALGMGSAIGAFGVASVKTGMEFDSAISQVAATMGKTTSEMLNSTGTVDLAWGTFTGNLREYALEMGKNTKFSATQAAEALNYMALAGYTTQESMDTLPSVLNLASAGNMELASASDMVTDALTALGMETTDAGMYVNEMAKTASMTNTSVEELGSAILTIGATAKGMKGGVTELNTALGILADNSIKGSEGGTAMRNVLQGLKSDKFEKTFGELGISAYDAEGNLRSLKDIFVDMNAAMDGWTKKQKDDIIAKTFNVRDLRTVNSLLDTSVERWDEITASLEGSGEAGVLYKGTLLSLEEAQKKYGEAIYDTSKGFQVLGAAEFMAMQQEDNLHGDLTKLSSAFDYLKISVSDKLVPSLRPFIQFLTWCINHASTLGPIILGLATAFGVFAVAINIGNIIKSVTTAMAAFNAILLANPIGIVVALIAGLVVAIIALWKNNEDFRNKVTAIWEAVKNKISSSISTIKAVIASVSAVVSSVVNTFKSIYNGMVDPIKNAYTTIKGWINKIRGFFPLSIGRIFSNLKLPHISVNGGKAPYGIGGKGSLPSFSVSWYKRAEQVPYLFSDATIFGAGEHKKNDEMLYSKSALMNDIREATSSDDDVDYEAMAETMGAIIGSMVVNALTGVNVVLDRRTVGKFTRQATGAAL